MPVHWLSQMLFGLPEQQVPERSSELQLADGPLMEETSVEKSSQLPNSESKVSSSQYQNPLVPRRGRWDEPLVPPPLLCTGHVASRSMHSKLPAPFQNPCVQV